MLTRSDFPLPSALIKLSLRPACVVRLVSGVTYLSHVSDSDANDSDLGSGSITGLDLKPLDLDSG